MHTLVGSDSGQHESKLGITGLPAHSCDRIGVPGWAPITEALAIVRAGVVLVEINLLLPWRICFLGSTKTEIRSDILWSRSTLPGLYSIIGYELTDWDKVKIISVKLRRPSS